MTIIVPRNQVSGLTWATQGPTRSIMRMWGPSSFPGHRKLTGFGLDWTAG
jgi:hypothetical protein